MVEKIKAFSDKMDNFFDAIVDNSTSFVKLVKFEFLAFKNGIVLFLKIFLLSEILFVGIKKIMGSTSGISSTAMIPIFYSGLIIIIWLILLMEISFEIRKNKSRIEEFLVSSFANVFAFLIAGYQDFWKGFHQNKEYIGVFIVVLVLCALSIYLYQLQNIVLNESKEDPLFQSRKNFLDRALNLLDINVLKLPNVEVEQIEISKEDHQRNILGIESPWGNGKTFFVQKLKKKLEQELCIFVEIDVLAYNLDELPKVLVKELDKVLYDNHIMSKYSSRLKDFFEKEKRLDTLYKVFGGKQYSYTETFHGFKDELKSIDKTIFIIYEDLDRIIDRRLIRKIFYISEKLSCEKIKIVYQYSMERLEKLGYDRSYVDKYIPNVIPLSKISLKEVRDSRDDLKNVITNNDLSMVDPEYFLNGLSPDVYLSWRRDKPLIPMKKIHMFLQNRYNVRTIYHFFDDIKMALDEGNIKTHIQRKTMIAFFFVQRFLPEVYKELQVRRNLEDCFLIQVDDKEYNFYDLYLFCTATTSIGGKRPLLFKNGKMASNDEAAGERKKKVMEILQQSINIEKYIAYYVFNYEYYLDYIGDIDAGMNDEKVDLYNQQNKMVWNLLTAEMSLKGDYQRIVDEIKRTIFAGKTFNIEILTLNSEIRRRFDEEADEWALYFAAFYIIKESEENWKKLIDRYWEIKKWMTFNPIFIESSIGCMRYFNDDNFRYFMEKMNELKIVSHLNKMKRFSKFLQSVFERICGDYLGLAEHRINRYEIIETIINQKQLEFFGKIYQEIDRAIGFFKERNNCDEFIEMGKVYKKTMEKLEELVKAKDLYNEFKPRPEKRDENYERLLTCSDDELNAEIKELKKDHSPGAILNLLRDRKARKSNEEKDS